jgi:hypothetical protein
MTLGTIVHLLAYPGHVGDGLDDVASAYDAPRVALVWALGFGMVFLVLLAPAFIDNWRLGIGPAFGFACVGFVIGAVWPWDLDNSYIDDTGYGRLAAGLFGGSLGWLIGAAVGWLHPRFAVERSERHARKLSLAATLISLLLTIPLLVGTSSAYSGPRWVDMFAANGAILAVTLLVFAQRNRFRQAGAVVGAIVALTIMGIAGIAFSSAMPSDRAWLDVWRWEQPEAASFAPNLLTPASPVCRASLRSPASIPASDTPPRTRPRGWTDTSPAGSPTTSGSSRGIGIHRLELGRTRVVGSCGSRWTTTSGCLGWICSRSTEWAAGSSGTAIVVGAGPPGPARASCIEPESVKGRWARS